ncbi:MAG TPA: hypothetical protein VNL15_08735, partial [Dehalococcoidia bacterium]|nr:hypothetical protein [Dehalococcoidia bacterium]
MENWQMCTETARGRVNRRYFQNISMGLGHSRGRSEELPGLSIGEANRVSENNQRGFYRFWSALMGGNDWSKIIETGSHSS